MKRALITGITGQDGSYLAEFLLAKGYEVYGMVRRSSTINFERICHIQDRLKLTQGDLLDQNSLIEAIQISEPAEIYNLGAQSFVPTSWNQPVLTGEFTALGVTKMLEAIRKVNPKIRFYRPPLVKCLEKFKNLHKMKIPPSIPRSPYGVAKVYGHWITVNYRESYGMFCCSGILFNHESPRRGLEFVSRKVTSAACMIKLGIQKELRMGNLEAKRDWGFAGDYVKAMWLMLQQEKPEDYVIATGIAHSVKDLIQVAFGHIGLDWEKYVVCDPKLLRPADVDYLLGDSRKARAALGWQPQVTFEELIKMMVDYDLDPKKRNVFIDAMSG